VECRYNNVKKSTGIQIEDDFLDAKPDDSLIMHCEEVLCFEENIVFFSQFIR
jgi:hypothetical protein